MAIYLTGDIHGDYTINKLSSKNWPLGKTLGQDDYVLILGDFGLVWNKECESKCEKYWLDWLDDKPWTTLFIDGNHENFDRLESYDVDEWHGGRVHFIRDSVIHLMRGEIYDICGNSFLAFGGARSVDKSFRTEGITWWPQEIPSDEERLHCIENLAAHDNKVDVIVTHEAPFAAFEMLAAQYPPSELCYWLQTNIAETASFKRWYFGHHHKDIESPRFVCLYDDIKKLNLSCEDGLSYEAFWESAINGEEN